MKTIYYLLVTIHVIAFPAFLTKVDDKNPSVFKIFQRSDIYEAIFANALIG